MKAMRRPPFQVLFALGLLSIVLGLWTPAHAAGPLVTLNQSSVMGPAAAVFKNRLYIAWTGTDNPNHLNVASSADGVNFTAPVVIPNNSSVDNAGPGLAAFNGKLYLSWTGGSQLVNYVSSSDGVNWSTKTVPGWTAGGTTSMTASSTTLFIAFTDTSSAHYVQIYNSADGVHWGPYGTYNYGGVGSPFSPSIASSPSGTPALGFATYAFGIGGSNCAWNCMNALNISLPGLVPGPYPLQGGVVGPGTSTTGGPGLAWFNNIFYLAWSGGFANSQSGFGNVYIAYGNGYPHPYISTPQSARGNPALVTFNGHLYLVWTGTDSNRRINLQWQL